MDAQLARTLGELERKLSALERTLEAMGQPPAGPADPPPPATHADPPPPATYVDAPPAATYVDPPPAAQAAPSPGGAAARAPGPPAAAPRAPAQPDLDALASRIVDEAIEPAAAQPEAFAPPSPFAQAEPAPPQPRAAAPAPPAAAPQPAPHHAPPAVPTSHTTPPPPPLVAPSAPIPSQSAPAAPAPPAAPGAATPPSYARPEQPSPAVPAPAGAAAQGQPHPGADELLRFRDRLESSARELTHEYDELLGRLSYPAVSTAPTSTTSTISFARGVPSLDIIDVHGLRDAAMRAFDADPEGVTAYGTAVGYPRLRAWIAAKHGVEPERVLVTNGSLQADAFLFDQTIAGGDEVVVESPTYDRTLLGLKERGARLHAVRLDAEGIDTQELARLLAGGVRPTLAHVIPNFQNPAGYTLSLERRRELLALAADYNFLILEDDPYAELRFSGEPQPTMLSLDPDRVVYASSFTKTVCPGVRVGYLVGPPDLIAGVTRRATNTYISPGMVSEALVYEFCASGALERSIHTVKAALAERARTLAAALRRDLPDADFVEPQGGYFMWVTLPAGTDVAALFDAAAERGVAFVKGTDFMLHGGENALRLAYSGVTPAEVEQGVARLADAYRSV